MQGYVFGAADLFHLITADVRRTTRVQLERQGPLLASIDSVHRL